MTKFLLDSGDPDEYKKLAPLAKEKGSELWGSTTNPSLIAKKLEGKKITQAEAFRLQKELVLEILSLVPGAVSAEVYADEQTTAEEMIEQGRDIVTWDERIYVKLPTTIEGFKARTQLRKENIAINNTLVFSQEQSFAICLHERILQQQFGAKNLLWPTFISPFVGRLDDIGLDGMSFVEHAITTKQKHGFDCWMLEASVRKLEHVKRGIDAGTEIMTAPVKVYEEWFNLTDEETQQMDSTAYTKDLQPIPLWEPPDKLLGINTLDAFMEALENNKLNIQHDLTDRGITKFAQDWKAIIQ